MSSEAEWETREASPTNLLVKIYSFSLIDNNRIDRLETKEFKAGNYMWKLVICPNGHGADQGYISVYLAITNTSALPSNWEVNATFSFCVLNHSTNNYRYSLGIARRFHALNPEWGFKKFIHKRVITDPSNGYVLRDKCIFGAEVFVNEDKAVIECMSLKRFDKNPYKHEIKISNFSTLKEKWCSGVFTVGGYKWRIEVYPNGCEEETGRSLSIFLRHVGSNNLTFTRRVIASIFQGHGVSNNRATSERVMPYYAISIKDKLHDLKHHQHFVVLDVGFKVPKIWDGDHLLSFLLLKIQIKASL
ncbi:hypothetical protein CASFOL_032479 [Castilleja foliolosa]|uniref:MATH domain-containing protein n=1 Tax=Castilleja foliolosa TaxID=1961234 RepID=A0ABD3C1K5_9LAMI